MTRAMRFAYADPPYVGQARRHYGRDEVDHAALIRRLVEEYPDGWALSASSPSLRELLPMCPHDVRVMAWVKPFASWKPGIGVAYAWEPVIVQGGRPRTKAQGTVRDWVSCNITLRRGLAGAKPVGFCFWLFDVLNIQPGDQLDDLFPGTGAVTRALSLYLGQGRLEIGNVCDERLPGPDSDFSAYATKEDVNLELEWSDWTVTEDGRHLCPECAAKEQEDDEQEDDELEPLQADDRGAGDGHGRPN